MVEHIISYLLLVQHLKAKGCSEIILINRTLQRAESLAADFSDLSVDCRLLSDLDHCFKSRLSELLNQYYKSNRKVFITAGKYQKTVVSFDAFTDANVIDISADYSIEPNTTFFPNFYISDNLGAINHKSRGIDFWFRIFKRMDHFHAF